jgi:hypothetical protein
MLRVGIAFALSDAAETLIITGLIERYFGAQFSLDRLRHVLGMLAAAVIGTCVSGIGGVVASVLRQPLRIAPNWRGFVRAFLSLQSVDWISRALSEPFVSAAQNRRFPRAEICVGGDSGSNAGSVGWKAEHLALPRPFGRCARSCRRV